MLCQQTLLLLGVKPLNLGWWNVISGERSGIKVGLIFVFKYIPFSYIENNLWRNTHLFLIQKRVFHYGIFFFKAGRKKKLLVWYIRNKDGSAHGKHCLHENLEWRRHYWHSRRWHGRKHIAVFQKEIICYIQGRLVLCRDTLFSECHLSCVFAEKEVQSILWMPMICHLYSR